MDFWFWSILKSFIRTRAPENLDELKLAVDHFFENVYDHQELIKVVNSLPQRWRAVCVLDGDKGRIDIKLSKI